MIRPLIVGVAWALLSFVLLLVFHVLYGAHLGLVVNLLAGDFHALGGGPSPSDAKNKGLYRNLVLDWSGLFPRWTCPGVPGFVLLSATDRKVCYTANSTTRARPGGSPPRWRHRWSWG